MDKIDYRDQIAIPAEKHSVDGVSEQGRLLIDFNVHGDPLLRWRSDRLTTPTVEEEFGIKPEGPYRWTAFRTGGKLYTVVLILVEPPFGVWWLGRAETMEQAERIFNNYITTVPAVSLGPSKSIGEYGI